MDRARAILPPERLDRQIQSEHQRNGILKLRFQTSRFQSPGSSIQGHRVQDPVFRVTESRIQGHVLVTPVEPVLVTPVEPVLVTPPWVHLAWSPRGMVDGVHGVGVSRKCRGAQ